MVLKSVEKSRKDGVENRRLFLEIQKIQVDLEVIDQQAYDRYVQCLTQREKCVEEIEQLIQDFIWNQFTDTKSVDSSISSIESHLELFESIRYCYRYLPGNVFDIFDNFDNFLTFF